MLNEIIESSKKVLKNGDDLAYLKCDFKYVIKRRARMIIVEKKGKKKRNRGPVGGQLVWTTSP